MAILNVNTTGENKMSNNTGAESKWTETAMLVVGENHHLWHRRLWHLPKGCVNELKNGMAMGLDFNDCPTTSQNVSST